MGKLSSGRSGLESTFQYHWETPPRSPSTALQGARPALAVPSRLFLGFLYPQVLNGAVALPGKSRAEAPVGPSGREAVICTGNYWWRVCGRFNSGIYDRLRLVICLRYIIHWTLVRGILWHIRWKCGFIRQKASWAMGFLLSPWHLVVFHPVCKENTNFCVVSGAQRNS